MSKELVSCLNIIFFCKLCPSFLGGHVCFILNSCGLFLKGLPKILPQFLQFAGWVLSQRDISSARVTQMANFRIKHKQWRFAVLCRLFRGLQRLLNLQISGGISHFFGRGYYWQVCWHYFLFWEFCGISPKLSYKSWIWLFQLISFAKIWLTLITTIYNWP